MELNMIGTLNRWIAFLCILMAILFTPSALAAKSENVSLNFVNAEIEEVIKAVSPITGKNFVVDPRV